MKEINEEYIVEIAKIETKLTELIYELARTKEGVKAAAQRFRVKSIALEKEMKLLRKYMLRNE